MLCSPAPGSSSDEEKPQAARKRRLALRRRKTQDAQAANGGVHSSPFGAPAAQDPARSASVPLPSAGADPDAALKKAGEPSPREDGGRISAYVPQRAASGAPGTRSGSLPAPDLAASMQAAGGGDAGGGGSAPGEAASRGGKGSIGPLQSNSAATGTTLASIREARRSEGASVDADAACAVSLGQLPEEEAVQQGTTAADRGGGDAPAAPPAGQPQGPPPAASGGLRSSMDTTQSCFLMQRQISERFPTVITPSEQARRSRAWDCRHANRFAFRWLSMMPGLGKAKAVSGFGAGSGGGGEGGGRG